MIFGFIKELLRKKAIGSAGKAMAEKAVNKPLSIAIKICDQYYDDIPEAEFNSALVYTLASLEAIALHYAKEIITTKFNDEAESSLFSMAMLNEAILVHTRILVHIDPAHASLKEQRAQKALVKKLMSKYECTLKTRDDFDDRDAHKYAFNMAAIILLSSSSNDSVIPSEKLDNYEDMDENTLQKYDDFRQKIWELCSMIEEELLNYLKINKLI